MSEFNTTELRPPVNQHQQGQTAWNTKQQDHLIVLIEVVISLFTLGLLPAAWRAVFVFQRKLSRWYNINVLKGIIKAICGLFCPIIGLCCLGCYGNLPEKLSKYYEPELERYDVVYDCGGWPVHPESLERTVQIMSRAKQFFLNAILFFTLPIAFLWAFINCVFLSGGELGKTPKNSPRNAPRTQKKDSRQGCCYEPIKKKSSGSHRPVEKHSFSRMQKNRENLAVDRSVGASKSITKMMDRKSGVSKRSFGNHAPKCRCTLCRMLRTDKKDSCPPKCRSGNAKHSSRNSKSSSGGSDTSTNKSDDARISSERSSDHKSRKEKLSKVKINRKTRLEGKTIKESNTYSKTQVLLHYYQDNFNDVSSSFSSCSSDTKFVLTEIKRSAGSIERVNSLLSDPKWKLKMKSSSN